jgi:hypothetical protein
MEANTKTEKDIMQNELSFFYNEESFLYFLLFSLQKMKKMLKIFLEKI